MTKIAITLTALITLLSCNIPADSGNQSFQTIPVNYPVSHKDTSIKDNYFGTIVSDPYRWLENDTSAQTADWVKEQNTVTQGYLKQIPFRNAIHQRTEHLFNYEKFSAPTREGKFYYFSKNSGLQNQSVIYRESLEGGEAEVFIDPNTFSEDGTTSLAAINFSKDGSLAAYNISEGGSDWQKIIVIDAINKKQIGDTLKDIKFSGASWKNNEGFFYSTYDRPKEGSFLAGKTDNHKLYFHKIGTQQKDDQLFFEGKNEKIRYVGGVVSENQQWLFIFCSNSTYGNNMLALDLTKPKATIQTLVADKNNTNIVLDVDEKYFYIQTDRNAPTGKIMVAPIDAPQEKNWKVLIDPKPEVVNASTAGGYIFCSYLKDAVSKVYQYNKEGKQIREVVLPGLGSAGGFSGKMEDKEVFYSYTDYTHAISYYKMSTETGKTNLYKKPTIDFNADDYVSKQVFYTSKDGTKIPMIITHKKGLKLNGNNPCLLYGYGGFSVSITPYFSTNNIILLENGGILAIPNLRGGGEYGETWHEQGIKTKKQNVFDDFIAAAQYLKDYKYTSTEKLALEGGSNGGLLVGAVITQQPTICKVAFPAVGVMDMLRYHQFTSGAGWAYDYGTSADSKEMFTYLLGYSPVHNAKSASYPATMITTADHDDRVVPAHSFKFAATMQENQKGNNPVLIRIETKSGHGAGMSTKQKIEEVTDKWSFMFYQMGIRPKY
jgi:prolyl oligopeptidase